MKTETSSCGLWATPFTATPEKTREKLICGRCGSEFVLYPDTKDYWDILQRLKLCDPCVDKYRAAEKTVATADYTHEEALMRKLHDVWEEISAYEKVITVDGFKFTVQLCVEGDVYGEEIRIYNFADDLDYVLNK